MIRASLIQTSLIWEDPVSNTTRLEQLCADLPPSDIVILPEMFSTGFSMNSAELAEPMTGSTVHWLLQLAKKLVRVVCGSVVVEQDGQFFNRFLWAEPDGKLYHYDKRHLFRMADEQLHYTAGNQRLLVKLGEVSVCPQVCYDLRFPVWSRNSHNDDGSDYDLLIYVANWPQPRREHWITLLKARAIENQCYVIGVNRIGEDGNGTRYSGDSMVVDYQGNVLANLGDDNTTSTVALDFSSLEAYRRSFPAFLDADDYQLILQEPERTS